MRVILSRPVKGLGETGAVVEVSEGYAHNYLLPKGLAVEATAGQLRSLRRADEARLEKLKREELKIRQRAESLAGTVIQVPVQVGEGGKMFGSVTSRELAEVLSHKLGEKLDRRQLALKEPLRALGSHRVAVKFGPGVEVMVTVVLSKK